MRQSTQFALGASLASLASLATALSPVELKGQNFVDSSSGNRFQILGVDYQPGGSSGYDPTSGKDALSDRDTCIRDAAMMQAIGFNTIRTYNVDPNISHDECMSIFNAVGIYVILDVNSPLEGESINSDDPASSYTTKYLERVFKVIDAFSGYPNLIGFFSGNEIINTFPQARMDPPYIRAVTRDMKQYIASQASRPIPVGYSSTDFRKALVDTANYVQCVESGEPDATSDFFALNSYSWCGSEATYKSSQYNVLARDFAEIAMPTFFSEYGCIDPPPRVFNEVPVLYGPKMIALSGGLVYEWTLEENGYGLVSIKNDGSVQQSVDLNNLIDKYNSLNLNLLQAMNSTARGLKPPPCTSSLIKNSQFSTDFTPPSRPAGADALIQNGAGGKKGKIISVTKTSVDVVVTMYGGSTTTGLTITPVSTVNLPGRTEVAQGPGGGSGPGSSSTSTHDGAAPRMATANAGPYLGFSVASFILWLLG